MKTAKSIVVVAILVTLPIESGCHLQAKRSGDFSALTTPITYKVPQDDPKKPATGFVGKAKTKVKDSAVFVGKGVLFVGGLVLWMWLDDDDETLSERHYREQNERWWKQYWRRQSQGESGDD